MEVTYFGRVVGSAGASVVEAERVFPERMSLRRRVGAVRLTLLLPRSVGDRQGNMVGGRKMVQREMVRIKKRSLLLPLQTQNRPSRVKVVASSRGPGGQKPVVKNLKPFVCWGIMELYLCRYFEGAILYSEHTI